MDILFQIFGAFKVDFYSLNIALQLESSTDLLSQAGINALDALANEMAKYTSQFVNDAKSLAAIFMLVYFSLKSYGIMTGDEKLEIMPLLRPFAILLVIALWGPFTSFISSPISSLETKVKGAFTSEIGEINALTRQRDIYVRQAIDLYYAEDIEVNPEANGFWGGVADGVNNTIQAVKDIANWKEILAKKMAIFYAKIGMWAKSILETIVVFIFRACFYLLFYLKIMFSNFLMIIGPLSFALSILPAYRDTYLKWISKFVSVLLYGFFGYLAGLMALAHVTFGLRQEVAYWSQFDFTNTDTLVRDLVMQTNGQYYFIVALIVGLAGFLCVPFVSHWIIGTGSTGQLANKATGGAKKAAKGIGAAGGAVFSGAKKLVGR